MHKSEVRDYSFQKAYRICKKKEINALFHEGGYNKQGLLQFRFKKNDHKHFRVVISISKKFGHSPLRNRIKRLIREALRQSGYKNQYPIDCAIFVTYPPREELTLLEIKKRIHRFFNQLS